MYSINAVVNGQSVE